MSLVVVRHSWHGDLVCSIERAGDGSLVLRAADREGPSPISYRWSVAELADLRPEAEVAVPGGAYVTGLAAALAALDRVVVA